MKTYAETKGQKPFDWNAFLTNPPEFESPDHDAATDLSSRWVTCACGNLCDAIPRLEHLEGRPQDRELAELGTMFTDNIEDANWPQARQTLAAIEARSAQLLKELQS